MDVNAITTAISTVGFPIVMCGLLFWYMIKQREEHAVESKETQEVIADLRVAITELTAHLKGGKTDA